MLINSNLTRGSQHFTIAHELFHLFYDENPIPHFCTGEESSVSERNANMFASALLMPQIGIIASLSKEELTSRDISIDTALKLEQLYGVSHKSLVLRLKELQIASQASVKRLFDVSICHEAEMRGYDRTLYQSGNANLIIGDFGSKARFLYENELISEGHYIELLNLIGYGKKGEDRS